MSKKWTGFVVKLLNVAIFFDDDYYNNVDISLFARQHTCICPNPNDIIIYNIIW